MFERGRTARATLLGVALALTLSGGARAGEVSGVTRTVDEDKWSWPKWWDYSGCVGSIAMAETPSGIASAVGMCGRMLGNWFKEI